MKFKCYKNVSLLSIAILFLGTGCGKGFNGDDEPSGELKSYSLDVLSQFADETKDGVFYIADDSEIFIEDEDVTIEAKEIHFGKNVKILSFEEETTCNRNGLNSGSLKIFADVVKGNPFVELTGQSASFCDRSISPSEYLKFIDAKPLKAGRSGHLFIHESAKLDKFNINLSPKVNPGSQVTDLTYKERTKKIDEGQDSGLTSYCVSDDETNCFENLEQSISDQEVNRLIISESLTLSENKRLVADEVIFKQGVVYKLQNFSLLVEASKIIFEGNVKFEGFPENAKNACSKDGTHSGNVFLMAKTIEGSLSATLLGKGAGNVCTTSQRFASCRSSSDKVLNALNSKRPYNGGNSGSLFLLKDGNSANITYNTSRSKGSKAYTFKVWANHHYGAFGSSSCNWSRKKKNAAGRLGNAGAIKYLEEGPEW